MRGRAGGIGLAALLAGVLIPARPAAAQDGPEPRFWPLREVNFPVDVRGIQALPARDRPTKLRFFAGPAGGPLKQVAEKPVDGLDVIDRDRDRQGFRWASPADGDYGFALQHVLPDGTTNPPGSDPAVQYRVVVDTRPPAVRLVPYGTSGVEWEVTDENPDPDGVTLEVRWAGTSGPWVKRTPRPLGLRDRYTWQGLNPNQPLEVRILARDRAGTETVSRAVSLPSTGAPGGLTSDAGRGFGGADDFPGRPQIDYVNTPNLTIASKLTRVTRSGVKAAHLWVNEGKTGWRKAAEETLPVPIDPTTPDPTIRMKFVAPKDGLYGFIVIPVNGAGGKQDDPRPGDQPQTLVEVDTELPFVKIKAIRVGPGGAVGPRVEVEWEAKDKNPMPEPVVLQYGPRPDAPEADWKPISRGPIADSGRYVWEVEDKEIWHFYVRAVYVDKASNRSVDVYKDEVKIDLEKPAAVIDRVEGSAGGVAPRKPAAPPPPPASRPPAARLPEPGGGDLIPPPGFK